MVPSGDQDAGRSSVNGGSTAITDSTAPVPSALCHSTSGRPFRIEKMLVAVKHDPGTDVYERANDEILSAARSWSTDLGASLHAVTCYEEGMHPDRQRFADRCGLDRNQVSAAIGSPEKVIAETAAAQGSDLVVIARVARPDSPSMLGNTARKVVDEIDTEVLILPVNAAPLG
jgi:hypothetical protein